jgi:recombination protein RecR
VSSDPIQRLVRELARLPGVGEKTAIRLTFHLVRRPDSQVRELAAALLDVVDKIRLCSVCMNLTELDPCALCADTRRDPTLLCAVATPSELLAIERAGQYPGSLPRAARPALAPRGGRPEDLRISELIARLSPPPRRAERRGGHRGHQRECEGEATALYLARLIKPLGWP